MVMMVVEEHNDENASTTDEPQEALANTDGFSFLDNQPSWWQRIRRWFYETPVERYRIREQRLRHLNTAIEVHPDAASNYVVRGELYVLMQRDAAAKADFQRALALLDEQDTRWGIATQALKDRALEGLATLDS